MNPALTFFVGFLFLALLGLLFWNLRLCRQLRGVRQGRLRDFPVPEPAVPPAATDGALPAPEKIAVVEDEASPAVAEPLEAHWQRRLVQAEFQHQLVQGELASLSYSISHDLRAPLRAIDGFSQALAEDYGHVLDATAQGYLQRVRVNARHMASLIEDLLSLSRLARAPLRRELLEVGPAAESIMAGLRNAGPERVVTLEIQPGLRAFADHDLFDSLLRHLLGNAWKFTSRRPAAHVSLRAKEGHHEQAGREIIYEVRDDGAGFDMNYAGKLFGAFQRMHTVEEFPGNGIGLATAQRIVRRHGGRVWAESVPDQGTAIFFTLGSWEESGGAQVQEALEKAGQVAGHEMARPAPVSLTGSPAL